MSDEIYKGPDWKGQIEEIKADPGEYTAADQARSWGIPEEQLLPEVQSDDVAHGTPERVE